MRYPPAIIKPCFSSKTHPKEIDPRHLGIFIQFRVTEPNHSVPIQGIGSSVSGPLSLGTYFLNAAQQIFRIKNATPQWMLLDLDQDIVPGPSPDSSGYHFDLRSCK